MKQKTKLAWAMASLLCVGFILLLLYSVITVEYVVERELQPATLIITEEPVAEVQAPAGADQRVSEDVAQISKAYMNEVALDEIPGTLAIQSRIDKQINTLRLEDTAASLKRLSDVEMFYWPGVFDGTFKLAVIPLEEGVGRRDVETILSNRRVLKLLAECSKLPQKEAGEMVRDELHIALAQYKELFEAEWERVKANRERMQTAGIKQQGAGPSLRLSNHPDGSPTLAGARLKVLSLLLIAGNLGLVEADSAVVAATKMAQYQREYFYSSPHAMDQDRYFMLSDAGIYNRQIIMTAIHGLSHGKFADSSQWDHKKLTTYDARATLHDHLGGPDFSSGAIEVWIHKAITDEQFDSWMKNNQP